MGTIEDEDGNEGAQDSVAKDVAEADFDRFCELMDLDVDPKGMDDDDKASYQQARRRMLKVMRRGSMVINEKGEPVFTTTVTGKAITFHEPHGAAYMAMDIKKAGHDTARAVAALSAMTQQPENTFGKLPGRDFKVCLAVLVLFLAG